MTALTIIGVILGIIGASPVILKALIYLFYSPDIKIFFPPVNNLPSVYSGGVVTYPTNSVGPHIINKSGRSLRLKIKLVPDRIVELKTGFERLGYFKPERGKFVYMPFFTSFDMTTKTEEMEFPSDFYETELPLPFIISQDFTLDIIVYPTIEVSEFKWLTFLNFLGSTSLRSIKATFVVRKK
jgi:hypothetical protein